MDYDDEDEMFCDSDSRESGSSVSSESEDDEFILNMLRSSQETENEILPLLAMMIWEDFEASDIAAQRQWGGSVAGKSHNVKRDFQDMYDRLVTKYFSGERSRMSEELFERRFRMPRTVFVKVWQKIENKDPFVQKYDAVTKQPGIHPLVRYVSCLRKIAYGDASDRADDNYEISESAMDESFKVFCKLVFENFAEEYLNRQPTIQELSRILAVNANRGFPGLFASWDCKHFPWKLCPVALSGQHKGKGEKNTLILEAICDADLYIWYHFFGEPGSLNDLNILDKSTIVEAIVSGKMDLRLPPHLEYTINSTRRNYLYFLVDGIYPAWPIFISTISRAQPGTKDKYFASTQEAVRKDIERAFGVLVKQYDILDRPLRVWKMETVREILATCIILHNMTVMERRAQYVGDIYLQATPLQQQEEDHEEIPTVKLFGNYEEDGNDDATVADVVNARVFQIDQVLQNELEHDALLHDLKEQLWNRKG